MFFLLLVGLVLGFIVYIFSLYNKFVTIKTRIEASIQEIGNQLKRQTDLIPNLVESVKGYMKHEQKALEMITEARKMVLDVLGKGAPDAQKVLDVSTKLQQALAPIRAVFESTPQLQAAETVKKLMDELRDTADKVMYARRTLIDLTADYNVLVVKLPSNLVAKMFGFKKLQGLKVEGAGAATEVKKEELKTPEVKLS